MRGPASGKRGAPGRPRRGMPQTIAVRVGGRTLERLQRGESVLVRLDRSNVVGGVVRRAGRRPGRNAWRAAQWFRNGRLPRPGSLPAPLLLWVIERGGTVDSAGARKFARRPRMYSSGLLSQLAWGGLLRREHWGRYSVTAKSRAARAELAEVGLYRKGCKSQRLAEWAIGHQRPFEIVEAARLLGTSTENLQVVIHKLLRDRVIEREAPGVYRAR